MSENERRDRKKSRPSFIWPLVFITLGGVILLSNLGLLEENIWEKLWKLWPILLVAVGLDGLYRRNEITGPVFMIGLGVVILLSNYGLVGWSVWEMLLRMWPVLLVVIGIEIIVGRRSMLLSALVVLGILGGLGSALFFFRGDSVSGEELKSRNVTQSLENIDQADISLSPAVGELKIDALDNSQVLIEGEVLSGSNPQPHVDYRVNGNTGVYKIDSISNFFYPNVNSWNWDLSLTNQIPLDLDFSMGAGRMDIDLASLMLGSGDINQAVGEIIVQLPEGDNYQVDISQAIGSIVVELPKNAGIRIEVSRAISNLDLPSTFEKSGDFYYSNNYELAENKIDVTINQAIGNISFR